MSMLANKKLAFSQRKNPNLNNLKASFENKNTKYRSQSNSPNRERFSTIKPSSEANFKTKRGSYIYTENTC